MAAKFQDSKTYPLPVQCFMLEFRAQPIRDFMSIKWVAEGMTETGAVHYQYQHGVNLVSWGETIDIWAVPLGERQTRIDIRSECYLPTQIMDWGKNREHVTNIFMYLDNCVNMYLASNGANAPIPQVAFPAPAAQPQSAPPVQQPYSQPLPQQPPMQAAVCPNCGAALVPGARFCGNCGTKLQ